MSSRNCFFKVSGKNGHKTMLPKRNNVKRHLQYCSELCSHTSSALNTGAKRCGVTCHCQSSDWIRRSDTEVKFFLCHFSTGRFFRGRFILSSGVLCSYVFSITIFKLILQTSFQRILSENDFTYSWYFREVINEFSVIRQHAVSARWINTESIISG